VSLELGGNAPFLVFDDADLDKAVEALMASMFRNAGQTCICLNRVLVQAGVYDKFAEMVTEKCRELHCGTVHTSDGTPLVAEKGAKPTVGPLINEKALEKVGYQFSVCCEQCGRWWA
jgi:succinate-semialdehyde dehydrogenase/glutarate-semialdehyde dehydrogenase